MNTQEELNALKEEVETLNEKLKAINGGTNITEVEIYKMKKIINTVYVFIPVEIRNRILEAYIKYGEKAAKSLAEKLTKDHPTWKGIIDLIP